MAACHIGAFGGPSRNRNLTAPTVASTYATSSEIVPSVSA